MRSRCASPPHPPSRATHVKATLPAKRRGEVKADAGESSTRRHDVGVDAAARNRCFPDPIAIVTRHHDWIAARVDAADDADVSTAAAPSHHRDGADLRAGTPAAKHGE